MLRERLPDRRASVGFEFEYANPDGKVSIYHATLGFYPDGRLGEVFLGTGKSNSDLDIATRDSAIALSLALQHGLKPEVMGAACLRHENGAPAGVLGRLLDILAEEGWA